MGLFSGKAAIVDIETVSYNKATGEVLCMNRYHIGKSTYISDTKETCLICSQICRSTIYLRGSGGFSKSTPLCSYSKYPQNQILQVVIPKAKPFCVYEEDAHFNQVLSPCS